MKVVFHLGPHETDGDRLLKSLLKNKGPLAKKGVLVPAPGRYRALIRKTIEALEGGRASLDTQEALLDTILDDDEGERLVLSNENFICVVPRIFDNTTFYPQVTEKVVSYSNLFHGHQMEFHLGLINPATFVPAICKRNHETPYAQILDGSDPRTLRWSSVVASIIEANPEAPITVWCNEDTPLIWRDLMHSLAGLSTPMELDGDDQLISEIMTPEGMQRFHAYMRTHPPKNETQYRRVVAAFLDKFARSDELETEVDLPGWDEAYIDDLTAIYEEDLQAVAAMPGVTFIRP